MIKKLARYSILHSSFFILVAVMLILGGCDATSDRSAKPSPDWSRGLRLGVSSRNQPVALQVDEKGHAHLIWYTSIGKVSKLHYVQLDDQARVVVEKDLDIPLFDPHKPQLLLDKRGNMHLACLAREGGVKSLFHFLLGYDGKALSDPTRLSQPGKEVESHQICLGQEERVEVFWSDEEGIYHLGLDERGDVISSPTLIVLQGTNPSAQVDSSGTIHLAWVQESSSQGQELYYAVSQELGQRPLPNEVKGIKLTQFGMGTGAALYGPVLGLDMDKVYIFWAIEQRSGLEKGTAQAYYVSFPSGQPSPLIPTRIRIGNSDLVTMPSVAGGRRNKVTVAFNVYVSSGFKAYFEQSTTELMGPEMVPVSIGFRPQMQLAMAVFAEGEMKGYQLAAKTGSASLRPNLVAEPATTDARYLHLTWLDTAGFGRYNVYYASTSPRARAWLDRTSSQDVLLKAAELVWGVLSGVALIPLAGFWILPPLIWIVLFYVFVRADELELRRVKVALGIAIALYTGAKLLLLPSSLFYLPFLDQVPSRFSSALVLGVPLIILVLALAALCAYARRAERATIFPAFFVFALTDALLSLAIYAPSFFSSL